MKIQFSKNYLTYKANEIVEIGEEATDLIAKGIAVEVKEDATASLLAAVDEKVAAVAEAAYAKGREETKAEMAKAFRANKPSIVVGADNISNDPKKGFKSFGHFAKTYADRAVGKFNADSELFVKAGISESADGAAVPTEYATDIFTIINSEDSLLSMCYQHPTNTNYVKLPIDNLVNIGSNAVTGAWTSEGTAGTAAGTGILNQLSFTLNKYLTLVQVTDEMLADNNVGLENFVNQKAGYDIVYQVNQAIVQGNGTGKPKGIVGSAATITVAPTSSTEYTSSGTEFNFKDIAAMKARFLPRQGKSTPVWLINPSLKNYVYTLKDDANRNLYFAAGTINQAGSESLAGIPIIWSWHCKAAGTAGDIILADMAAYTAAVRSEGVQSAMSLHLGFASDLMSYRFTYRLDGKPGLLAPFVSPDGSGTTFSPFVVLGNRT